MYLPALTSICLFRIINWLIKHKLLIKMTSSQLRYSEANSISMQRLVPLIYYSWLRYSRDSFLPKLPSFYNFLVEDCKEKWKNLRDSYKCQLRAYIKKHNSGAGAVPPPTWKWWSLFDFLRGTIAASEWVHTMHAVGYTLSSYDHWPNNKQHS